MTNKAKRLAVADVAVLVGERYIVLGTLNCQRHKCTFFTFFGTFLTIQLQRHFPCKIELFRTILDALEQKMVACLCVDIFIAARHADIVQMISIYKDHDGCRFKQAF